MQRRGGSELDWHEQRARLHSRISEESDDGQGGLAGLLQRLCRGLTADLAIAGATISLMHGFESYGVVAASDQRSRDADEVQFTAGEGPCHDAFRLRRPVLTPDLDAGLSRWPGYCAAALAAGLGAVFAFPLQVGSVGFGVLDLYANRPGSLSPDQETTALRYALVATEILVEFDLVKDGDLDLTLSHALDYRGEIYQAQGMTMIDLGVVPREALSLMRAHAFAHDMTLAELARDIVAGYQLGGNPHSDVDHPGTRNDQ